MFEFASGPKSSYYGKGDVVAYRLRRDGDVPPGRSPVFGVNVTMLIYGEAFWPTYTTGDNEGLVATDSMKNFIQHETLNFEGYDLESYARYLGQKFLDRYPQTEGVQLFIRELPFDEIGGSAVAFAPSGPGHANVRAELIRKSDVIRVESVRSGIADLRLLRLGGSSFKGFVRDEYTTLPEINNRPLYMWLDLEWSHGSVAEAFSSGSIAARVREIVDEIFLNFESGSIQQIIHEIGTAVLNQIDSISEIRLEANNRTWDTVAEAGESLGVYTEPRPPYGCLGLTLRR